MTWWQRLLAALRVRPAPPPPLTPWTPPPSPPPIDPDPVADPTGFVPRLNAERARHRLPPVAADADLTWWAMQNNQAQATRGLGHWTHPPAWTGQNVGMGYPDAAAVLAGWLASPPHRANLLHPTIARAGCAHATPYWTFNGASSS